MWVEAQDHSSTSMPMPRPVRLHTSNKPVSFLENQDAGDVFTFTRRSQQRIMVCLTHSSLLKHTLFHNIIKLLIHHHVTIRSCV